MMDGQRDDKHKDKLVLDEGSPITVGGGGGMGGETGDLMEGNISCRFRDNDYPNAGGKTFRHQGWKVQTFKISTTQGIIDYSNLLPENGNCVIVVHCSGDNDDIVINGRPFGIDMDPSTYPGDGDGIGHTNPDESYISRIDLIVTGSEPQSWFFNEDDGCAVCVDHIPNSPYCS